ncbi:MAG: sigma-70 family RNA polymerase sigma factor [Pyrinomonadaceae bacterium]
MPDTELTGDLFLLSPEADVRFTPPEAKPEALIVERIRARQVEAFDDLYRMFAPMVHGIVLSRVPREEADDVVQEVFIAAYKNLNSLRDTNAVGPWLAKIARNFSAGLFRGRRQDVELTDDISEKRRPENEANEILAVILRMPLTYKETLVLRLVEGMTGPEIAEQTGMTPDSVRVNLHRGMKMLRRELGVEVK